MATRVGGLNFREISGANIVEGYFKLSGRSLKTFIVYLDSCKGNESCLISGYEGSWRIYLKKLNVEDRFEYEPVGQTHSDHEEAYKTAVAYLKMGF